MIPRNAHIASFVARQSDSLSFSTASDLSGHLSSYAGASANGPEADETRGQRGMVVRIDQSGVAFNRHTQTIFHRVSVDAVWLNKTVCVQ
jgi:hypothetical protein